MVHGRNLNQSTLVKYQVLIAREAIWNHIYKKNLEKALQLKMSVVISYKNIQLSIINLRK